MTAAGSGGRDEAQLGSEHTVPAIFLRSGLSGRISINGPAELLLCCGFRGVVVDFCRTLLFLLYLVLMCSFLQRSPVLASDELLPSVIFST